MTKKAILLCLCSLLLAPCSSAVDAQQAKKIPQIGFLSSVAQARDSTRFEAIRLGLRELGYMEGQNLTIEYRY